jgi:LysM repeat protein
MMLLGLGLLFAGPSGCVTGATQEEAIYQQQSQQLAQQQLEQMRVRIETLIANQEQLQAQIQQLRAQPVDRASQADVQALQARIAELDRRIASIDAARAQDRQEIVSTLSRNMSAVMAQGGRSSGSSSSRSSGGTTKSSGSAAQKGYEHTVGSGETISAIALAYKVKTADIVSANNLKDPGHLKVGQKLFIPAP